MKRIFSFVLFAALMVLPIKADSYHDALVKYMSGADIINTEQYRGMLAPLAQSMYPGDPNGEAVINDYLTNQMMNDLVDIYEPAFRRHVSLAELNELNKLYADPRFAKLQKKSMEIVQEMQTSQEYQAFIGQFSTAIQNIMLDQPARDVQIADDVPADYREAFYLFYRKSRIDDVLNTTYQSLFTTLEQEMRNSGISDVKGKVDKLSQYTSKNMPKVLLALFSSRLTLDEIKLISGVTDNAAYQHSMDAVTEMAGNPMKLGTDLIEKMADWMGKYYPKYAAPLYDTLKMLK